MVDLLRYTADGTFVDEDLTQRQTDLALQARLAGREVIVYVLIEHQRTVDPLMAVRMQRYQSRIWDRYMREHPGARGARCRGGTDDYCRDAPRRGPR
ncbi:MAG: Rpn family recombination-promoting nuclease/putative transposase [Microlunatus sp.]